MIYARTQHKAFPFHLQSDAIVTYIAYNNSLLSCLHSKITLYYVKMKSAIPRRLAHIHTSQQLNNLPQLLSSITQFARMKQTRVPVDVYSLDFAMLCWFD